MGTIKAISRHHKLPANIRHAWGMFKFQLKKYIEIDDLTALDILRSGIVIADEPGQNFNAELDVVLTRKIQTPYNPELAAWAVAEDGNHI